MTYKVASSFKSPALTVGLPIPGKNNPFLILPSVHDIVYLSKTSNLPQLRIHPPTPVAFKIRELLESLLDVIGEVAGKRINISVTIKSNKHVTPLQLAAASAAAAVRLVREFVLPLSVDETLHVVQPALTSMETHTQPLAEAYVVYLIVGSPIVYRRGEGYVKLRRGTLSGIKVKTSWSTNRVEYVSPPLIDELTLLSGRLVVEAANAIMRGDVEEFLRICRVDRYLSRIFYSTADDVGDKIVPDIKGYMTLEVERSA